VETNARILVIGTDNFVGAALVRALARGGHHKVFGAPDSPESDLSRTDEVAAVFQQAKPDHVFMVAGKSGGIHTNQNAPATLMLDNLLVGANVIHRSHEAGVKKLLYLASSCTYPRSCPQPMKEDALMTGRLEPTNEAYALAKLSGMALCQAYRRQYGADFISAIPANPFGPGDDFSPENSHVIAALLRRMHEAKCQGADEISVWGTGSPRRDFIYVDDLAEACLFLMERYSEADPINIGSGKGVSIAELAQVIKSTTRYPGGIAFDRTKPDGMPLKVLDTGKLDALGWQCHTPFPEALKEMYRWYREEMT
jgi:GDP-L-fucose synthase